MFKIPFPIKKNVGKIDRIVRVIVGTIVLSFGIFYRARWGVMGIGMMIPALLQRDPLYAILGLSTKKGE
jgi:hypothetical protein